jgi:hypothetical protein
VRKHLKNEGFYGFLEMAEAENYFAKKDKIIFRRVFSAEFGRILQDSAVSSAVL